VGIIPILRAREIVSILRKAGFIFVSQKGSHVKLKHHLDSGKVVTVPFHNKDVPRRTLISILKQADVTLRDFLKLLGREQ